MRCRAGVIPAAVSSKNSRVSGGKRERGVGAMLFDLHTLQLSILLIY